MRRLNFHVNSKILSIVLCVILVCVFTLTIAYAALSAVLTISGSAEVVASNWDIHLENARVISGSVSNNAPSINGNTLSFSAHLDVPGDYYEFVVDVVNEGSIDAMIDSIVVTPTLTDSQKKYLKYEVKYQNGEDVSTKQTLYSESIMPLSVRVEYKRDLEKGDLPTEDTVLNSSLTLVYTQSDGTGSSVANNGYALPGANGDIDTIGTIVTIGTEQFYVLSTDESNVTLLSMYNLHAGGSYSNSTWVPYSVEATGMQDSSVGKAVSGITQGVTPFASETQKGTNYSDYIGSIPEFWVNNYVDLLEGKYEIDVIESRLITMEDLTSTEIGCNEESRTCSGTSYKWIYSTAYWTGTSHTTTGVWCVGLGGGLGRNSYIINSSYGIRPVIVISKYYF